MSNEDNKIDFEALMRGVTPLEPGKELQSPKIETLEVGGKLDLRLPESPKSKFHGKSNQPKRRNLKIDRHFKPDRVVDLHGEYREEALKLAEKALRAMPHFGHISLILITGKGLNSPEGPVLKNAIWDFLEDWRDLPDIDFQWAPKHLGGDGAIVIWLL